MTPEDMEPEDSAMQPTPKQAERLQRVEVAVKQLDKMVERGKMEPRDVEMAVKTISDALESLRILVAQTIDAL